MNVKGTPVISPSQSQPGHENVQQNHPTSPKDPSIQLRTVNDNESYK
jgi:hypothetical protein